MADEENTEGEETGGESEAASEPPSEPIVTPVAEELPPPPPAVVEEPPVRAASPPQPPPAQEEPPSLPPPPPQQQTGGEGTPSVESTKPPQPSGASLAADMAIPMQDEKIMAELKSAEEQATKTIGAIEILREAIKDLSKKEYLTEEDASVLQLKQTELMQKLAEFERVTKRIQDLIGLKNVSSSMLGPPFQCRDVANLDPCSAVRELKTMTLPKVIICGNGTDQIPKIIVCDPVDNNSKKPIYQQFPLSPLNQVSQTKVCQDGSGAYPGSGQGRGFQPHMPQTVGSGEAQFVGTVPPPVRLMPGMMGQPPITFGLPQQQQQFPGHGMMPRMMTPMQGVQAGAWPQGMLGGQPRSPFQQGMGPSEPYRTGPQEDSGMKSQNLEEMHKQINCLQEEMKKLKSENEILKNKLTTVGKFPEKALCKMSLGKVPVCKMDVYNQMGLPLPKPQSNSMPMDVGPGKCQKGLTVPGGAQCKMDAYKSMGLPPPGLGVGDAGSKDVETMVASMEEEVRTIQKELDCVQAERRSLELQKKVLQCVAPVLTLDAKTDTQVPSGPQVGGPPSLLPQPGPGLSTKLQSELQHRELVEKYAKLQEAFNQKVEEVSLLRVELDKSKRESLLSVEKTKDTEARVDDLLERLKTAEEEEKKISSMREQMIEIEQQLILAKQRYREANEEVEGLKTELNDLKTQADEYREKYMKAQQTVEEQKNQLDMKDLETARYQEQFMLEFQRVKANFQSKLEELTPYPEMLKKLQNKLREAVHLKSLAEKNCMALTKNLETSNEEREKLKNALDEINKNKVATEAEKDSLKGNLTDGEKRMEETKAENSKLKAANARLEELALKTERKYEEKAQEVLQLQSGLETLREESARQVSRTKDYCEGVKRSLLGQISELERQVAAAKAAAKLAQQDRDIIRQKMQAQITHLNDNFEQAQMRIRNLQSHVNYLKSSFTNMIAPVDVPFEKNTES